MKKKYKKLIALVAASFAFVFVAAGLHSTAADAEVYYGGNYIVLSSYYAAPGQSYTVNGYRFYPGEQVTVSAGSDTKMVTADSAGYFTLSFTVPQTVSGSESRVTVSAHGRESNIAQTATLVVAGFYPTVVPSGYFVSQGSTIMVSGSGFSPNEPVTVTMNGTPFGSIQANGSGAFANLALTVPTTGQTDQTYVFHGTRSGAHVQITIHTFVGNNTWQGWLTNPLNISLRATSTSPIATSTVVATSTGSSSATAPNSGRISVSESSARFGDWISITGTGYEPNESVTLYWDGQFLASSQAGATGGFYVAMPVPEGATGSVTIRAESGDGSDSEASFMRI